MKRKKVQAQRKFAQGVPIPQSTQTTNVDKVNTTMQKDPDIRGDVFHSTTSATGLLDVISFQNLHRHKKPIVLLERLRNYSEKLQASSSAEASRQQIEIQIPTALKHSMCLRSKTGVKRLNAKHTSILKNYQPKTSKDASFESQESCNEDNQPLKFLAKDDKKNKKVNKIFYTTSKDIEKRVRFDIDDEPVESDSIDHQQKSGQHYNQPSADSENNNTSEYELIQPTDHTTRRHQRNSGSTQELEQETSSRPVRKQRSRSKLRPGEPIQPTDHTTRLHQRNPSTEELEQETSSRPVRKQRSRSKLRPGEPIQPTDHTTRLHQRNPSTEELEQETSSRPVRKQRSRSKLRPDEPIQPTDHTTRLHQRNPSTEELEQETPSRPVRRQRSRSMFRPDVKKPRLASRSRQRSVTDVCTSDYEDLETNEESIGSRSKIDKTKNTNIYRGRLRSSSVDEASKLRRESNIDQAVQKPDEPIQPTDHTTRRHQRNSGSTQELEQETSSRPVRKQRSRSKLRPGEPIQPTDHTTRLHQRNPSTEELEQETSSRPVRKQRSRSKLRPGEPIQPTDHTTRLHQRNPSTEELEQETSSRPVRKQRSRSKLRPDEPIQPTDHTTRLHQRNPSTEELEQETPSRPVRRQRSRSMFRPDVKKPRLASRSRQRSVTDVCTSDYEDLETNEESIGSRSKIDKTKNTNIYRGRLRSSSVDEASKLRRESNIDQAVQKPDELIQPTDHTTRRHQRNSSSIEEWEQETPSRRVRRERSRSMFRPDELIQPTDHTTRRHQRNSSSIEEWEQETPSRRVRRERSRSMFRPDELIQPTDHTTRRHQRNSSSIEEWEQETPSRRVRRERSRSMFRPDELIQPTDHTTRRHQRNSSSIEEWEQETPSRRVRRERSRSMFRPGEPIQPTDHTTRLHQWNSSSTEEFEQDTPSRPVRQERSRSMLRPGEPIQPTDHTTRLHQWNSSSTEEFEQDTPSRPVRQERSRSMLRPGEPIQPTDHTTRLHQWNSSSTEEFEQDTPSRPVRQERSRSMLRPEAQTNLKTKNSKVNLPKKGQQLKSANSDGNIKPVSSHSTEHTSPSTSHAHARPLESHNMNPPTTEKHFSAPLSSRRMIIRQKQTSSTEKHSGSTHTSGSVENYSIYCPSKNYSNMNEIIYADIKNLVGRCKTCKHCAFLDKVMCVVSLFKIQYCRKMIKSKILEYDDEEGSVMCASGSANRPSNEYTTQYFYLLHEKHSDYVVEMKRVMLGKKLIKIKISAVPWTLHIKLTLITVADNDRILDDIINNVLSKKSHVTVSTSVNTSELFQHRPSTSTSNNDKFGSAQMSSNRCIPTGKQTEAPTFYPTEAEFKDPIAYFNKIMPSAAKFGLCKVVAPKSFKPKCMLNEEGRFGVTNQYIHRMYKRWGPAARELCAIKAHLASQSVIFSRPPLLDGVEVNLPNLYYLVQTLGGLKEVIEKKLWTKVAEEMNLSKTPKIEVKLDQIYVKYILPYDTLRTERDLLLEKVDEYWTKKNDKAIERAMMPLPHQIDPLGESDTAAEMQFEDVYVAGALADSEDCITNGRQMNLLTFKKVANKCKEMFVPSGMDKNHNDIEQLYWKNVLLGQDHICVNSASIDTGELGYGFTKDQRDSYGKHPWNLKALSQNSGNMLRFLGPIGGVTVPTLHLGMVFSTSCWHRDPHSLPWIEYMHSGPGKIWYGIPNEQSANFRKAVELLCPTSCQNKSIWLPSDMTMIPPDLLLENNVSMSRAVQEPRQFIILFPKAYSSSIATGYSVTESVYFAAFMWLQTVEHVFNEARENCEPTMFSLEHLLVSAARDTQASTPVHRLVNLHLWKILNKEMENRKAIAAYKIPIQTEQKKRTSKRPAGAWNVRDQDECEFCQMTLYFSKVRGLRDKRRSMCLQHALQLLDTGTNVQNDLADVELEIFLSDAEIKKLMVKIGG